MQPLRCGRHATHILIVSHTIAIHCPCGGQRTHSSRALTHQSFYLGDGRVVLFVFSTLHHKSIVFVGKFGGLSNDIFRNKLPEHAFVSHTPLAPPWGLSPRPNPRGAQGLSVPLNQDGQQRSNSVKSQDNTKTLSHYFSFCLSEERNRGHIFETMVLHPRRLRRIFSHRECRRPSHCRGRANAAFPNSIPSSPL